MVGERQRKNGGTREGSVGCARLSIQIVDLLNAAVYGPTLTRQVTIRPISSVSVPTMMNGTD